MSLPSISPTWLFFSVLIGGLGMAFFIYGKKQERIPQLMAGIALMAYPYFVSSTWLMVAIGAAILGALWLALRQGM